MMYGSSAPHKGSVENVILLGSGAGKRREGGEGMGGASRQVGRRGGGAVGPVRLRSRQGPVSQVVGAAKDSWNEKWFIFKLTGHVLPA